MRETQIYEIWVRDEKPFPFSDWPEIEPEVKAAGETHASDENTNVDDVPTFVDSETGVEAVVETINSDVDSNSETKVEKSE